VVDPVNWKWTSERVLPTTYDDYWPLFGALNGMGENNSYYVKDWIVFEVYEPDDYIQIGGNLDEQVKLFSDSTPELTPFLYKFRKATVVEYGSSEKCAAYLIKNLPSNTPINFAYISSGNDAYIVGGNYCSLRCGEWGTLKSGVDSELVGGYGTKFFAGSQSEICVRHKGQVYSEWVNCGSGLKPNTWYQFIRGEFREYRNKFVDVFRYDDLGE
jgi:hypothetical protein